MFGYGLLGTIVVIVLVVFVVPVYEPKTGHTLSLTLRPRVEWRGLRV